MVVYVLMFSEGVIDFLGGSTRSQRPERIVLVGKHSLISSTYYSDSYLQIVEPNYSPLFNI